MKWVYVPIMFALAVAYTKFSFNSRLPEASLTGQVYKKTSRAPASEAINLNDDDYKKVPSSVLYKHLKDQSFISAFQKIAEYRGTIVGNPHAESFGFVVDDRSRALFAIRDFQDAGSGLFLHDVLGHLASAKTFDKKVSWINYFDAYKRGLEGHPHIYSYYVEKGLGEAIYATQRALEENVSNVQPFEFSLLKKNHKKVLGSKKTHIQEGLKKNFLRIQFFDILEESNEKKYHVLARVRPQDKIQWLELIETSSNDYDQAFSVDMKSLTMDKKIELIKADIFEGKLDHVLGKTSFEKREYIVKFSDNFSARLNLKEIPIDDYHDIFLDEAYVLGKIHSRSLGDNTDSYIKAWAMIPGSVVDEKMIELKYRLKDFQE